MSIDDGVTHTVHAVLGYIEDGLSPCLVSSTREFDSVDSAVDESRDMCAECIYTREGISWMCERDDSIVSVDDFHELLDARLIFS